MRKMKDLNPWMPYGIAQLAIGCNKPLCQSSKFNRTAIQQVRLSKLTLSMIQIYTHYLYLQYFLCTNFVTNHYIYHMNGSSYLIFINTVTPRTAERGNPDDYRPVVCAVTNGFNMSFEAISLRNKCDRGWDNTESGYGSWGFNFDGQAIALRNAETLIKANYDEVANLAVSKRVFWAKMADIDNKRVIEGLVRIGSYTETADLEEPYSFTFELVGLGEPILEENAYILVWAANEDMTDLVSDDENNLILTE